MKALQELMDVLEAQDPGNWQAEMARDAGLKKSTKHKISDDEATAAMQKLKAAGHKKRSSGLFNFFTHKKNPGLVMSFDYEDDPDSPTVKFLDRRANEDAPASNRMYGMDAPTDREKLISKIEGRAGTLESVPYHKISTEDLQKILAAMTK